MRGGQMSYIRQALYAICMARVARVTAPLAADASRRVTCINHRLIFDIVSHLRVAPERGADRCARQ